MQKRKWLSTLFHSLFLFFFYQFAYAVVISPDTVITMDTSYSNTTIDLSAGNFVVQNKATLSFENCNIIGVISPTNPNLISVELGTLVLKNNNVNITSMGITPTPKTEPSYFAIRMGRSSGTVTNNTFFVDKQFTVGLLTSSVILPTKNFTASFNKFENFHGVLYLLNSNNTVFDHNTFKLNSAGQIVLVGNKGKISNNYILFPGLNELGDAIDIINSHQVVADHNIIFTPTSQGIAVYLSDNVKLDWNVITGGITYGIHLLSAAEMKKSPFISAIVAKLKLNHQPTSNITITNNYLGQNRYGIAAMDVNNLVVKDNFFTQKFADAATRAFWTNNDVLFQNVSLLTWYNNTYKEAFTQVNKGDNSLAFFAPFPVSGGVVL